MFAGSKTFFSFSYQAIVQNAVLLRLYYEVIHQNLNIVMEKISDYVTALIIGKITGTTSDKEQKLLHELRQKFEPVQALSDFLNEYPSVVERESPEVLKQEARAIIRKAKLQEQQRSLRYRIGPILQYLRFWDRRK